MGVLTGGWRRIGNYIAISNSARNTEIWRLEGISNDGFIVIAHYEKGGVHRGVLEIAESFAF
jgi:hypothetical protein